MKILLPSLLLGLAFVLDADATDIVWTNTSGGNWSVPANWNPNQTPGAADTAIITNDGTYTVTLDVNATIGALILGDAGGNQTLTNGASTLTLNNASVVNTNGVLSLGGGSMDGNSLLSAGGALNWTGGYIYGSLTVASSGMLNLSGSAVKYLYGPLTNAGTVIWTGMGDLYDYADINNLVGGLFDLQNNQVIGNGGGVFFANAGTLRKSAGSGISKINVPFHNSGAVNVQDGTIEFDGGGTLDGQFSTTNSTALNLTGGSFTQAGSPTFSGSGQSQITSGTLTLTTDVIAGLVLAGGNLYLGPSFQGGSITNLTLAGMSLQGTNTVSGALNWTGGYIYGSLTVASSGMLNLSGSAIKYLYGPLTNAGTVTWTGTGDLYDYADINNLVGGLFDVQNNQTIGNGGGVFFANAGTLRKSAGSGTTHFQPPFDNSGTVEARTGTINLPTSYSNSPSAILAISLGGTTPGSGYGHIHFTSPLIIDGGFTVSTRNGFAPSPGDTFNVLSYPSATNEFTCLSGLDLGGGVLLLPQFSPTGLSLVTTTYATNNTQTQLFINRSPTGVRLTWPLGFPDWELQSNTSLSSTNWSLVPVQCDSQALQPVTEPQRYFRLSQ